MWATRRAGQAAQFIQHHRRVQVSRHLRQLAGHIQCPQPCLAGGQQKLCESAISLDLFERMGPNRRHRRRQYPSSEREPVAQHAGLGRQNGAIVPNSE